MAETMLFLGVLFTYREMCDEEKHATSLEPKLSILWLIRPQGNDAQVTNICSKVLDQ
jgi:hypothetical protein